MEPDTTTLGVAPLTAAPSSPWGARVLIVGFVALLVLLPMLPVPPFWIAQLNYVGLYALVALGIVLLTGVGGMTSFGQAAFVGIGAYASAYATTKLGWSPWAGLAIGLCVTAFASLLLGALTLRMSGHYLPLATICWSLALYYAMGNAEFLGKHDGLLAVPPITIGSLSFLAVDRIYYLIWTAALLAALGVSMLLDSRPGRVMRSLNPNHGGGVTMPEAMGTSTYRSKVTMFVLAALLASTSGWLFAHMQRSVNPSPFGIHMGIEYLFMAVVGGLGSVPGAFLGAAVVKIVEDQLQVWLPSLLGASGNFELIVFGLSLVLVLKFAPRGLWPLIRRFVPREERRRDWAEAAALPRRPRAPAGRPLLEVNAIRKQFGGLVAVKDVSFRVAGGEIVGLIGPNGAGKSTTFNLVTGVIPLSGGQVSLSGRRLNGMPSREIARCGVSRTFQHVKLVPEMSVLENVAIGCHVRSRSGTLAAMLRLDRAEERRVLREAERQLVRIGLGPQLHSRAGDLALGQQRLVEIARALASDPTLMLLDEPAAGLRHHEKRALATVLRQLQAEGMSLLLVEHDMDFVMNLCDRLVVMEFGQKLMEGVPDEVRASPLVRAAYLGTEH